MNIEQALQRAEQDICARISASEEWRQYRFEPVQFHSEYERCWVFIARSEDMAAEGYAPAAVFAYIDKQDGHSWSEAEVVDYFYATPAPENIRQREQLAA
jgi:hypothetical protein